jgi:hypothetical protein
MAATEEDFNLVTNCGKLPDENETKQNIQNRNV